MRFERKTTSERGRTRRWLCAFLVGAALSWASVGLAENAGDVGAIDEGAYNALAWAGWVGWAVLMVLVSLQYRRQRRLATKIARLERTISALEERSERNDKKRER